MHRTFAASSQAPPVDDFNRALRRQDVMALGAYQRHQKFVTDYYKHYRDKHYRDVDERSDGVDSQRQSAGDNMAATSAPTVKTDFDIIRRHHRFIRTEADDDNQGDDKDVTAWGRRVAKKYYDRLFKEYCLVELREYEKFRLALRWRTEKEVLRGKGQFQCGALDCDEAERLRSWEVPFAYREAGEKKAALVKVRLCEDCSRRLHYAQKRGKKAKRAEERVMDDDEAGEGTASENKRRRGDDEELVEDHASQPDANESTDKATAATSASTVWSEPSAAQRAASDNQRATSKAEEFDQFFAGMFE